MKSIHKIKDDTVNLSQYRKGQKAGFYESYFLRANHPEKPHAFWIRYTVFNPHKRPGNAIGEIWATYFNGETGNHVCVKDDVPMSSCSFSNEKFNVDIDQRAFLDSKKLHGGASVGENEIAWELSYAGDSKPLFFFPLSYYMLTFPKAKSLVSLPLAYFNGVIIVNGEKVRIENWVGSQNHNWGSKHTDHYAWGQVAGFDNHPVSFLEIGTARLKFGPIWTPFFTIAVLRHQGREYRLNTIRQGLKAKGVFDYFTWTFATEDDTARIDGAFSASARDFAGLTYYNPPGGEKHCLNSKIAGCEVKLTHKNHGSEDFIETLKTTSRAAFEILTDDRAHGVKMYV